MAILHHIKIRNFRGIRSFEHYFNHTGVTCIIGRGDSGKSTILEAISYVLTTHRYINFYDSDFWECDPSNTIEIEATLCDVDDKFLAKYGDYVRGIKDGQIIDDMFSEEAIDADEGLTIKLEVKEDLEPSWTVYCNRDLEIKQISAFDRSKLNVLPVTDYDDRQFTLNNGTPLSSLYKTMEEGTTTDENLVLNIIRETKSSIDTNIAEKFKGLTAKIQTEAQKYGVNLSDLRTLIDQRDITINQNKISLHEGNLPLRLKGKGSRRLLSIAVQLSIVDKSSIVLIDEIEHGLEPDRVQHLVSTLVKNKTSQIIFTTHSSNVLTELSCENLYILRSENEQNILINIPAEMQGTVRSNPEAFFAKKIIVCEGATEIGFFRAINEYRIKKGNAPSAYLGIRYADGGGKSMIDRAKCFNDLKYDTCLLCDSDIDDKEGGKIATGKSSLKSENVTVIDCASGLAIEQQVFNDVSWDCVKKLIGLHIEIDVHNHKDNTTEQSVFDSIHSKLPDLSFESWLSTDDDRIRGELGNRAKDKDWYKNITDGQSLGDLVIEDVSHEERKTKLQAMLYEIENWIEK